MTDSLRAAANLAHRIGAVDLDDVLPVTEPVISCDDLAVHRIELRQVAGISAGGRLELRPGSDYDFGPVRRGHGKLDDGQPDVVGFTLSLDDNLVATIGPGTAPVTVDSEPVMEPTEVNDRVINAGTARFVVARPRPPRKRDVANREERLTNDHWVWSLLPTPLDHVDGAHALVDRRRRLHIGPDDVSYRLDGGGALLWDRDPDHPLFGTSAFAVSDVSVIDDGVAMSLPVPVSVDLLSSPTMLAGERSLQLAVARHLIMSLATTVGPRNLSLELRSSVDDLAFVNQLPHAESRDSSLQTGWVIDGEHGTIDRSSERHRLVVVDRPTGDSRYLPPGFHHDDTSFLILTGETDALSADADVLSIVDESSIGIMVSETTGTRPTSVASAKANRSGIGVTREVTAATPIGFAQSMTDELAGMLCRHTTD